MNKKCYHPNLFIPDEQKCYHDGQTIKSYRIKNRAIKLLFSPDEQKMNYHLNYNFIPDEHTI